MKSKKWTLACLLLAGLIMAMAAAVMAVVDPLFHFHGPQEGLRYAIYDERYQNDGIVRHFGYDAVITGTSMTENFKTSEFDELFGVTSVKVPFSGGTFLDIDRCLARAFSGDREIKCVVRSLDLYKLAADKDSTGYDEYPTYLYDDSLFNDVQYVLNKEILVDYTLLDLVLTLTGQKGTSMDAYGNWTQAYDFGKQAVIDSESRERLREDQGDMTEAQRAMVEGNLAQNVIAVAQAHPETTFYLFFPPYSVFWWDSLRQAGTLEQQFQIDKLTIELLLPYDNIRLYSFADDFDLVTDFDEYKDPRHFSEDVSSRILRWMREGKGLLTADNYQAYCDRVRAFYSAYDYDSLYE